MTGMRMVDRWNQTWHKLQVPNPPPQVLEELTRAYSSPDRSYHTLSHIEDCLSILDHTASLATYLGEVELAIWFHDAVYDARRSDNEQRSAEWAKSVVYRAGLGHTIAQRVAKLILATRHRATVSEQDAQVLVDVDLS